jgi:hypothetical protein
MVNGREFFKRFLAHVATLRSTEFVARNLFACEGWFRVELMPALVDTGVRKDRVIPEYKYPGTRNKADLALFADDSNMTEVVFELKHFVQFADANKKQQFPVQIGRLTELVHYGVINQGIIFMAFSYLNSSEPNRIISNSFQKNLGWLVIGPQPLLPGGFATVALATITS